MINAIKLSYLGLRTKISVIFTEHCGLGSNGNATYVTLVQGTRAKRRRTEAVGLGASTSPGNNNNSHYVGMTSLEGNF